MELKLGSLFDGIGGWPLAAIKHGIKPVWASEIEPFTISVTERHFPEMKHLGDLTKINGAEIEPVDVITFGSPCTRLSVAGNHDGFDIIFKCEGSSKVPHDLYEHKIRATDKYVYIYEHWCPVCGELITSTNESALFFHAIRIINEMRDSTDGNYPRFAVWENVPGAFSSNKGDDFRAVLEEITESKIPIPGSGKWSTAGMVRGNRVEVAWRVLDAQYWGVPQRRKRIFLVADFGGCCAGEILFKPEGVSRHIEEIRSARKEAAGSVEVGIRAAGFKPRNSAEANSIGYEEEICPTLSTSNNEAVIQKITKCYDLGEARLRTPGEYDELCPTLSARMGTGGNNVPSVITIGFKANSSIADNAPVLDECIPPLQTTSQMAICYALQGSMIGRKLKNGPQGDGVNEEVSFTLNTIDRHAVAIAFGEADLHNYKEGRVSTLKASGGCLGGGSETIVASVDCRNLNENKEISGTLQSKSGGGYSLNYQNPVRIGYKVRRLTPTECERLQGLPDGYTAGGSDTQRYKALGNAMAQPCPDYVMEGISNILRSDRE